MQFLQLCLDMLLFASLKEVKHLKPKHKGLTGSSTDARPFDLQIFQTHVCHLQKTFSDPF